MNIRTAVLLWLAALASSALTSVWWALNAFSFPEYAKGNFHWFGLLATIAALGTLATVILLVMTIWYLIEKGDK